MSQQRTQSLNLLKTTQEVYAVTLAKSRDQTSLLPTIELISVHAREQAADGAWDGTCTEPDYKLAFCIAMLVQEIANHSWLRYSPTSAGKQQALLKISYTSVLALGLPWLASIIVEVCIVY